MRLKNAAIAASTLLVALGAFAPIARANTVEITFLGITPNGLNWDYRYSAVLTPNNYLVTGDVVTFFDFENFLGGSFAPSLPVTGGENYSTPSYSDAPVGDSTVFSVGGDLALGDVQFRYIGNSPYFVGPGNTAPGDLLLGFFTLQSSLATGALDLVITTDTSAGLDFQIGTTDDAANTNFRSTTVARQGGFVIPTPLPIPVWGGMALMGLLGVRRLKGAKSL